MSIAKRIKNIISSSAGKKIEDIERAINKGQTFLEEELEKWEKKLNLEKGNNKNSTKFKTSRNPVNQLNKDLAIFQLKKGAPWIEVKKAYRRESKKYHSDFFQENKTKLKISVEIMQIYNEAYSRLKGHYGVK